MIIDKNIDKTQLKSGFFLDIGRSFCNGGRYLVELRKLTQNWLPSVGFRAFFMCCDSL
jgi:hypothetical protein